MTTGKAGGTKYYKAPSKFVRKDHPFGDDARFRRGYPSLRKVLKALDDRAKALVNKLLHLESLRGPEIYRLLRMIGVSSDEPMQWTRPKRRNAAQLARNCKKLANEIEDARTKWPFGAAMIPSDYFEWGELPRVLRSYASAWEKQLSNPIRSARSPRNINIIRLLDYIKDKTGRYHYAKVAALLNAIDAAYGWERREDSLPRWDADNLKEIIESRNRQAKKSLQSS